MKIEIRKATIKDIPEVIAIASIPGLENPEKDAPSERWLKAFIREKQIFLVAEKNKQLQGFVIGERTTGDIGYLWEIGVLKEKRNSGIGTKLLKNFEEECKKRKLRMIAGYGHTKEKTLNFFRKNKFVEGENFKELSKRFT